MTLPPYDEADAYDELEPYDPPTPTVPAIIEAWVTEPDGTYIAHLDRSDVSPFRAFAFHRERNAPGGGSLEYHLDNALVREHPAIFAKGNLVHMRYRDRERVWAVRDNGSQLGSSEHAGDWVKVAGVGVWPSKRLVFPPDFEDGDNLDPKTWSTQWRSAVNRAAGELIWDLLEESNPRFATQFVRGTVETTGADGITVDHRFEDIGDDVIPAILAMRGGDVEFEGLVFNYYAPGYGVDRSDAVIFEEGADLVSLGFTSSRSRDTVSWVVGEGVGEGVFAKLAVADSADTDRREAFYAAKDAGNLPLLELMTDAALDEHGDDEEALAIEVDESRYRAFDDYDLADTVRVFSTTHGVDRTAQIEAIYVAEEGDQVRVAFDLGQVRTDADLELDEEIRKTRSSLGVNNRQPQGQMVPINANGADVFDETDTMDLLLDVLEEVFVLVRARVVVHFREFFAPATAASSGGGATTTSGGSASPTTSSGGGSSPTSSSDGSHRHRMFDGGGGAALGLAHKTITAWNEDAGVAIVLDMATNASHLDTKSAAAAHSHTVTVAAHSHTVTVPAHSHDTPNHTHTLDYGVFKEAMPASHNVAMGIYRRDGSSWDLVVSISGLTDDVEELDVTQYVDGPGLWRFSLQSEAGQPNGGRLAADMSVAVLGAIQSS